MQTICPDLPTKGPVQGAGGGPAAQASRNEAPQNCHPANTLNSKAPCFPGLADCAGQQVRAGGVLARCTRDTRVAMIAKIIPPQSSWHRLQPTVIYDPACDASKKSEQRALGSGWPSKRGATILTPLTADGSPSFVGSNTPPTRMKSRTFNPDSGHSKGQMLGAPKWMSFLKILPGSCQRRPVNYVIAHLLDGEPQPAVAEIFGPPAKAAVQHQEPCSRLYHDISVVFMI